MKRKRLKRRHFPPSARETEKESSIGQRVKRLGLIDVHQIAGLNRRKNPLRALVSGNRCKTGTLLQSKNRNVYPIQHLTFISCFIRKKLRKSILIYHYRLNCKEISFPDVNFFLLSSKGTAV